jgi:c-di-GMP-binding flagellar brake protein YcgR
VIGSREVLDRLEVRDISLGGVRIHSPGPLSRGSRVSLEFDQPEVGLLMAMNGEIVWVRPDPSGGGCEAGARFIDTDTFTASQLLSKVLSLPTVVRTEQPAEPAVERRRAPRLVEPCPVEYRRVSARWFSPWHPSVALDLSGSGVAFRSLEESPLETLLSVRVRLPRNQGTVRARGTVVWCTKESENPPSYRVGLHFLEMSAHDQHLLAGYIAHELQERIDRSS